MLKKKHSSTYSETVGKAFGIWNSFNICKHNDFFLCSTWLKSNLAQMTTASEDPMWPTLFGATLDHLEKPQQIDLFLDIVPYSSVNYLDQEQVNWIGEWISGKTTLKPFDHTLLMNSNHNWPFVSKKLKCFTVCI